MAKQKWDGDPTNINFLKEMVRLANPMYPEMREFWLKCIDKKRYEFHGGEKLTKEEITKFINDNPGKHFNDPIHKPILQPIPYDLIYDRVKED